MKELMHNIDSRNKWLIALIGIFCFVLYVIFLFFRPQESWCDDAFWADWARQLAVHNRYYKNGFQTIRYKIGLCH